MPHSVTLISTIAAALGLALIMGVLAARLKLPPLVGYLIAGIIIGPATPGFVADVELSAQLAEIGVMLLMFGVGLHFSLKDLWRCAASPCPAPLSRSRSRQCSAWASLRLWGWSLPAGIVFGLALSVASTVVLLRALGKPRHTRNRQWSHRGRLAHRRGSRHGPRSSAAARIAVSLGGNGRSCAWTAPTGVC